jgi:hypothetical protein
MKIYPTKRTSSTKTRAIYYLFLDGLGFRSCYRWGAKLTLLRTKILDRIVERLRLVVIKLLRRAAIQQVSVMNQLHDIEIAIAN